MNKIKLFFHPYLRSETYFTLNLMVASLHITIFFESMLFKSIIITVALNVDKIVDYKTGARKSFRSN
jgi:hypothetical protein